MTHNVDWSRMSPAAKARAFGCHPDSQEGRRLNVPTYREPDGDAHYRWKWRLVTMAADLTDAPTHEIMTAKCGKPTDMPEEAALAGRIACCLVMRRAGYSGVEIAKFFGCTQTTVYGYLRSHTEDNKRLSEQLWEAL